MKSEMPLYLSSEEIQALRCVLDGFQKLSGVEIVDMIAGDFRRQGLSGRKVVGEDISNLARNIADISDRLNDLGG